MRQNPAFLDHLVEWQHEIARHTENLAGTVFLQGGEQCFGKFWNVTLLQRLRFRPMAVGLDTAGRGLDLAASIKPDADGSLRCD
jgi:hypothetical protein